MRRFIHRRLPPLAGLLALGAAAIAPGCDWLKASDMVERVSPFLSSFVVSPAAVLCNQEYTGTFRFDDPQGDIKQAKFTLQREGDTAVRERTEDWPADVRNTTAGTVHFTSRFECGTPGGRYVITVIVEDDHGHTSNTLTGGITLNAAG